MKETNTTFLIDENSDDGPVYSLAQQDLTLIKPNYQLMIKQGTLKVTDMGVQHGKQGLKSGIDFILPEMTSSLFSFLNTTNSV